MPSANQEQLFVAKSFVCEEEKNGKCIKYRGSIFVKGMGIDVEAVYGMKIRNCIQVYRNKMPVGQLCAEGQSYVNGWLVDGMYADALKAVLDMIPEGWHSVNEPTVKALVNIVREIEEYFKKPRKS